jgi:hypothetical protein
MAKVVSKMASNPTNMTASGVAPLATARPVGVFIRLGAEALPKDGGGKTFETHQRALWAKGR